MARILTATGRRACAPAPPKPIPTTIYAFAGAFVQDEITFGGDIVSLFPALRFDHCRLDPKKDSPFTSFVSRGQSGSRVTPRIGMLVKANETVRLFANYTQGFRAPEPNQVNNGFANIVSNDRSIPRPDLDPETICSVQAGMRLNGQGWSVSGTAFSSRFRDFIDQIQIDGAFTVANPAVYQYVNRGRVRIEGLEGTAECRLDAGLSAFTAASYAKERMQTASVAGRQPLDSIEPFKFVGGVFYQSEGGPLRAEAVAPNFAGKKAKDMNNGCNTATTACFTLDGFWTFHLIASLRLGDHVTARAGLFNLTDRRYFWWSDVRGVTSTIRDAYSQPGRNVSPSLMLTLRGHDP